MITIIIAGLLTAAPLLMYGLVKVAVFLYKDWRDLDTAAARSFTLYIIILPSVLIFLISTIKEDNTLRFVSAYTFTTVIVASLVLPIVVYYLHFLVPLLKRHAVVSTPR